MTNVKAQMTKDRRMTNDKIQILKAV